MTSLQRIKGKYLSIHPVKDINLEDLFPASLDYYSCLKQQQDVLHHTVLSATALKYPPHQPYTKSFLKALINQLEKNGHEVDEELYLAFTSLLQISCSNSDVGGEYSYRTYTLRDGVQVTLKETTNLIAEGTTGLRTWQASCVLLDYLLDRPAIFDGKRVLELGAGLGLLGIGLSSSRRPPSLYTLTDLHPTVLDTLEHNVSINLPGGDRSAPEGGGEYVAMPARSTVAVAVERLDWEDEHQLELWAQKTPYELILAADVVFDPILYRPLLRTISSCLNGSPPPKSTLPQTSSEKTDGDGSITGCSRSGNTLKIDGSSEPENSSMTGATQQDLIDASEDISSKRGPTSRKEATLLANTEEYAEEAPLNEVGLAGEERTSGPGSCSPISRSSSKSRNPVAILAATVRNEEALDSFLSLLGAHGLSVTDEVEEVYQVSPSQPEHRVRILHIGVTSCTT